MIHLCTVFHDIEGSVPLGMPAWVYLAIPAAIALVALAWLWLRRRNVGEALTAEPQVPAIEIARAALAKLRSKQTHLAADPFTVCLSDIVRGYLEAALRLPVREQTTEEFLEAAASNPNLPDVIAMRMPGFLEHCDRIKFAQQDMVGEQRVQLLDTAADVIETVHRKTEVAESIGPAQQAIPPAARQTAGVQT